MRDTKNEIRFEIMEHIGILEEHQNGWNTELNIVSWNGNPAKYDIRDWSPDRMRMSKGLTFTEQEMKTLVELTANRELKLPHQIHKKSEPEFER